MLKNLRCYAIRVYQTYVYNDKDIFNPKRY